MIFRTPWQTEKFKEEHTQAVHWQVDGLGMLSYEFEEKFPEA